MFAELASLILAAAQPVEAQDTGTQAPLTTSALVTPQEWATRCEPWDDWEKSAPPFMIASGVYYVGTCGIASTLIVTQHGYVLIDTGTTKGALHAIDNMTAMGLDPKRIGLILYSHEHFDHVGGMSVVQWLSGAPVLSAPEAANVFRTGEDDEADPQFGMHEAMVPARNVVTIQPGNPITFGGIDFTPIATPGHTPGALSWKWDICEGDICKTIVHADSLSPISRDDYRFSDNPAYLEAYRAGLEKLGSVECDILLTPHPSHSRMVERAATGTLEGGVSCADYAARKNRDLDARLVREKAGK